MAFWTAVTPLILVKSLSGIVSAVEPGLPVTTVAIELEVACVGLALPPLVTSGLVCPSRASIVTVVSDAGIVAPVRVLSVSIARSNVPSPLSIIDVPASAPEEIANDVWLSNPSDVPETPFGKNFVLLIIVVGVPDAVFAVISIFVIFVADTTSEGVWIASLSVRANSPEALVDVRVTASVYTVFKLSSYRTILKLTAPASKRFAAGRVLSVTIRNEPVALSTLTPPPDGRVGILNEPVKFDVSSVPSALTSMPSSLARSRKSGENWSIVTSVSADLSAVSVLMVAAVAPALFRWLPRVSAIFSTNLTPSEFV